MLDGKPISMTTDENIKLLAFESKRIRRFRYIPANGGKSNKLKITWPNIAFAVGVASRFFGETR